MNVDNKSKAYKPHLCLHHHLQDLRYLSSTRQSVSSHNTISIHYYLEIVVDIRQTLNLLFISDLEVYV